MYSAAFAAVLGAIATTLPAQSVSIGDPRYPSVSHVIDRAAFDALPLERRNALVNAATNPGWIGLDACFQGDGPSDYTAAISHLLRPAALSFVLNPRWTATASQPGPLQQGDPTVVTYSFVPDGTPVTAVGTTEGSSLFATFDASFGSTSAWQDLVHLSIQRWAENSGLVLVHEPNDDGAPVFATPDAPGLPGIRGDIRFCARTLDGGGPGNNVIGIATEPNSGGDIVLDVDNMDFFTSTGANFARWRNTVSILSGRTLGLEYVCPLNFTKRMEPFVLGSPDGPQFDDILGAQRHYGDRFEHNDSLANATLLTSTSNTHSVSGVTIDGAGDEDWFRFELTETARITVSANPEGESYQVGPSDSVVPLPPCTPIVFHAGQQRDLRLELHDANGLLASQNQSGAGFEETLAWYGPLPAGTYYVRVFGGATDAAQMYSLDVEAISTTDGISISLPEGAPATVNASSSTLVDVTITGITDTPDPATATLQYSFGGPGTQPVPLHHVGGDDYQAVLPPQVCGITIEWFVTVESTSGDTAFGPAGAPDTPQSTLIGPSPLHGCTPPTMLPSCADGSVPDFEPTLFLSGTTGGYQRRLDAAIAQPITIEIRQPSVASGPVACALFYQLGVGLGQTPILPFGQTCIGAGLANPPLLAGVTAPITIPTAGLGGPLELTMQGVVFADFPDLRFTNAITLNVQ